MVTIPIRGKLFELAQIVGYGSRGKSYDRRKLFCQLIIWQFAEIAFFLKFYHISAEGLL